MPVRAINFVIANPDGRQPPDLAANLLMAETRLRLEWPERRTGRPAKSSVAAWRVEDDWPACAMVTAAEIGKFEIWDSDLFDE